MRILRIARLAPFLIPLSFLQADEGKKVENPPVVSKEGGDTKTDEAPKVINVKLKGLTDEENKALSQALAEIKFFFKKYTKDKPYNHEIISDLSPDLKFDLKGLGERAKKMPDGIERLTLEAYPNSGLESIVESTIEMTAQNEFEKLFKHLGVVKKPDKKVDANEKVDWTKLDKTKPAEERVKIADLEKVEEQLRLIKKSLDQSLGEEVGFPGGVTGDIVEAIQRNDIKPLVDTGAIVLLPKKTPVDVKK